MCLTPEIAAFENFREELERTHLDQFALFSRLSLSAYIQTSILAGGQPLSISKKGPFLIQQIGSPIGLDPDSACICAIV